MAQPKRPDTGLESPQSDRPMSVHSSGSGGTAIGDGAIAGGEGSMNIGGDVYGDVTVGASSSPESIEDLRRAYLSWLMAQVRAVPLAGVDPGSIDEESRRDLDLAAVYTALMTQRTTADEQPLSGEREHRALSALAVLNAEPRVALLGDPGSGKSTFVNFLALCLAGEQLGRQDANLEALRAPVPTDDDQNEQPEPQPWDRGFLLPVRVILREFVARGLPAPGSSEEVSADTLFRFIAAELPEALSEFAGHLRREWHHAGGLLLLDGLDEVPEADARRVQVKRAVEQFAAAFPKVVVLVTSRTYAYQKQDWKLHDFTEAVLTPFERPQIRRFVERWYHFVGRVRQLAPEEIEGRTQLLNEAIFRNPRLYELATRPLLLTLMASLHAWRGGTLPEQREALYADAVELLLDQWERQKVQRGSDGLPRVEQPSLSEWLQVDQQAVREALNLLAFEVHRDQPSLVGTADIAQARLVEALMKLQRNPDLRPARLIEYLSHRAGLLEGRGVDIYAFPHRTFQEYLAACHLTDEEFPDALAELALAEPNRWREVTLLAGAKATRGTASAAWTLAEALCYEAPPETGQGDPSGYWGALLAALVLTENKSLRKVTGRNQGKVDRIRAWLVDILQQQALPAVERAQAGDALAHFDDPRFDPNVWYLPKDELWGFMAIPEGPFTMGSDNPDDSPARDASPAHPLVLPTYYISRFPVTVSQFRTFVEMTGYTWARENRPQGGLHHPVVYVSWQDAMAYCDWLTEELRQAETMPEPLKRILEQPGGRVTLPSEAEWEKAARGTDRRTYPWEGDVNADLANYSDTGIGSTSPVGCFPQGRSPYGVEECSGNVWEWTRSLRGDYPYPSDELARQKREELQSDGREPRVLRGGAFYLSPQLVRCAVRLDVNARGACYFVGFRVVLSSLP